MIVVESVQHDRILLILSSVLDCSHWFLVAGTTICTFRLRITFRLANSGRLALLLSSSSTYLECVAKFDCHTRVQDLTNVLVRDFAQYVRISLLLSFLAVQDVVNLFSLVCLLTSFKYEMGMDTKHSFTFLLLWTYCV